MSDSRWVPDNADGSGWATVDWVSSLRGTRYHYRHGLPLADAIQELPAYYLVVTRLESAELEPHENRYFVRNDRLADFLAEVVLSPGAERLWHVEPCQDPPPESNVSRGGS
jgi:hypothetical protein